MNAMQMGFTKQQIKMLPFVLKQLGGLMGTPQGQQQGTQPGAGAQPTGLMGTPPSMIAATPQQLQAQGLPPNANSPSAPPGAMPSQPVAGVGGAGTAPSGGPDPMRLAQAATLLSAYPMYQGMAKQLMADANLATQTNPQLATRMAAAKSPAAVDQALLDQAKSQGADPSVIQGLQTQLQTALGQRHIGSMSGINTWQNADGSWTTIDPRTGLQTNTKTGSTLVPGAAGAQQAMAAAHARGEAAGDVEEVTDSNGNKFYVPRSTLLGGGASGTGASGTTPFQATTQASVGPASAELLKGKGEQAVETNKEYQSQAEAAQQMLAQIAQLRTAANDFTPGQFANARIKGLQWLQSTGLITPDEMKRLGSAQEGTKIHIQLQASMTKQLGSREAAQIFEKLGQSMPGLTLSPDGFQRVSSYMAGVARYNMARAQVAQQRLDGNDANGVNDVRNNFIKNTDPTYYIVASAPPAIQKEMIGSMGAKGRAFLENWQKAANAGWAPRPTQYANQP
jgi:hypothetical protein